MSPSDIVFTVDSDPVAMIFGDGKVIYQIDKQLK